MISNHFHETGNAFIKKKTRLQLLLTTEKLVDVNVPYIQPEDHYIDLQCK
jgi:hypothetical protein